jgi:hypothetical protein
MESNKNANYHKSFLIHSKFYDPQKYILTLLLLASQRFLKPNDMHGEEGNYLYKGMVKPQF